MPNERVVQTSFEYKPFPGVSVETMTLEDLGEHAGAYPRGLPFEGGSHDRLEELLAQRKRTA